MDRYVITLGRFIIEQERDHPGATGALTSVLYDLTQAAKLIHREVSKAGLVDILGKTGKGNVHGEEVQKLDEYAHDVVFNAMDHGGDLCVMASEEEEGLIQIPEQFPTGDYVLLFDPLDGSSNIDANISIGTIFSLHKRISEGRDGSLTDCLQPGSKQVAAGYIMYGSSTVFVYTTGSGVHGFTLDPSIGEFLLSHGRISIPEPAGRVGTSAPRNRSGRAGPSFHAVTRKATPITATSTLSPRAMIRGEPLSSSPAASSPLSVVSTFSESPVPSAAPATPPRMLPAW
jgi:fructose-1,6-bisphosphatase I